MSYEYDDLEDFYGIDADDRTNDYWAGNDDLENDSDDSFDAFEPPKTPPKAPLKSPD